MIAGRIIVVGSQDEFLANLMCCTSSYEPANGASGDLMMESKTTGNEAVGLLAAETRRARRQLQASTTLRSSLCASAEAKG